MRRFPLSVHRTFRRHLLVRLIAALGIAVLGVDGAAYADISAAVRAGTKDEAASSDAQVQRLLSDAQRAVRSGDLKLGLILLKNAVGLVPKNGLVRMQLGSLYLEIADFVDAERELKASRENGAPDQLVLPLLFKAMLARHEEQVLLDEYPDPGAGAPGPAVADVLRARALAFQGLGRTADAADSMDRALTARRDIPGLLARARLAMDQNNPNLARSIVDEAFKRAPGNSDVLLFKITLLMQSGDNAGALKLTDALVQLYPDTLSGRVARIELLLIAGADARAKSDVDLILSKTPDSQIGNYYKALLLARAHDVKGAWGIAQSLTPEFTQSQPAIAYMVAQMAIASGSSDTGGKILSKILEKSPDLIEVRLRLASVRLSQNSPETALTILRPLMDSSDTRVLAMIAQVYLAEHHYSDALEYLNKLNATGTAGVNVKRALALTEMQAGQTDQGIKDLLSLADQGQSDPTVVEPLVAAMVQAERFPEALAAADRLAADPAHRVQAFYLRGQILLFQGNSKGALAAFQKALDLDPNHIASLYYRAGLLEDLQKFSDAIRDLQTILTVDPKNVSALVKLAEIAARQNQDGAVRSNLAKALSLAPKDAAPRLALADYLFSRNDLKGAQTAVTDLLRILPDDTDGLKLLGQIQMNMGEKDQAIATFRRLSTLLPRSADPQLLLGNALLANGDRAGAAGALNAASSVDPSSIEIRAAQINVLFSQANVDGAVAMARAFATANPSSDADVLLADTLVRAKEPADGLKVLAQSFTANPNGKVLLHLAKLSAITGDKKTAESLMGGWLETNPRDLTVRTQYAEMLLQDGLRAEAVEQFEAILKQDPKNVGALNNLGWLLATTDSKRAVSLLTVAYKINPKSAEVADTFGWIKLQLRDAKGAVELLTRAHALQPKEGEITFHLVLALDASGDRSAAKAQLKALLDSGTKFAHLPDALKLLASWH